MLGERIKIQRKKVGITLQELADRTHLSTGYVSNIERSLTSPTVENLSKICKVLQVEMSSLLEESEDESPVIRKSERIIRSISSNEGIIEEMTKGRHSIWITSVVLKKEHKIEYVSWMGNDYEQYGVVIKGEFEITIDNVTYHLNEGDTIYVGAKVPFRYRKLGEGECITYWFNHKNS